MTAAVPVVAAREDGVHLDEDVESIVKGVHRLETRLCFEMGERLLVRWAERMYEHRLQESLRRWIEYVREKNEEKMEADRVQWALHAECNANDDLQAWYHFTFADELYRLRGPFWHKEAVLPEYTMHPTYETKHQENTLSSPNATYTAMAATMYTVRGRLAPGEYSLFEQLTTEGAIVLKHPYRTGRPQKKRFQLSLVQGDMYLYMYLTWKGKHGMQGIELASVTRVASGVDTDALKRTIKPSDKPDCFLSLVTADRSLDLCFEAASEQALWASCLTELVALEQEVKQKHYAPSSTSDAVQPPPPPLQND